MSVLYYGIFAAPHFQNFIDKHFFGLTCYVLPVTTTNVDEHFWLFYNLSTNTYFLRLEVSRGKYPIIKYTEFSTALHKSSKWEVFVVPYNFGRLVLYEAKNAITVVVNEHFLGNAFGTLHIV